jgi:hypothetical protein
VRWGPLGLHQPLCAWRCCWYLLQQLVQQAGVEARFLPRLLLQLLTPLHLLLRTTLHLLAGNLLLMPHAAAALCTSRWQIRPCHRMCGSSLWSSAVHCSMCVCC